MCAQATCIISYTIDIRGTVNVNAYSGKCLEPPDECSETCTTVGFITTCNECDVPVYCKGKRISCM